METWSVHQLYSQAEAKLGSQSAFEMKSYAQNLRQKNLPVIFSLKHLSNITGVDYTTLRATTERRREAANYKIFAIAKRSGGRRYIHQVSQKLFIVQQFVNTEILSKIRPHPSSFAYHSSGGIYPCAANHCRATWMFKFDLRDFFYSVTESDVYDVFSELGYKPLLAFELARICTTTHLPKKFRDSAQITRKKSEDYSFYQDKSLKLGVLPQGAPTSPMLSNLVAAKLDENLYQHCSNLGFTYTRYSDDLTISCHGLPDKFYVGGFINDVKNIIYKAGFRENPGKRNISRPGSKKLVLGLLVDLDTPRLSKQTVKRIDRNLHAAKKFGIDQTAKHEGFDSAYGFFNHLSGLIAYTKSIDEKKWRDFKSRLDDIEIPWQ